jgi:hypothetical protein
MDFHDSSSQAWKLPSGWGCHNVLSWCTFQLSSADIEARIGVILPPTLALMDDWEPAWRGRGVGVLQNWVDKVDTGTMMRMRMDRLLLASLLHTLELHANPPLPHVLPATLRLIERTSDGESKAKLFEEVVQKAIVSGWMYAPSGPEGRVVLINISREVEMLCGTLGIGIVRWLKVCLGRLFSSAPRLTSKTIIPNLLSPLQYLPTPAVAPHFRANLSALLCVIRTLRDTLRIPRWRGQILDIVARLWVQLHERETEASISGDGETSGEIVNGKERRPSDDLIGMVRELRNLVKEVVNELERQCPQIREAS